MSQPSICFVSGSVYPLLANSRDVPIVGGAEVQQFLMGQGLRALGFQVTYITEDFGQGSETSAAGFRVLSFQFGWNKLNQALTLIWALRQADADIYYVRDAPRYGLLIYVFCQITRRKIVQALANDVEVEPVHPHDWFGRLAQRVHTAWRRRADLVIAQTQYQAERLSARWGTTAQVVTNIVPVKPDLPEAPPDDCFRVLWVGRIVPFKRPDRLAEIARCVPEAEFVVVGAPARDAPAYFQQVDDQLKNLPNVRWLRFVPYAQVGALFRSAHVLLHTSDPGREGFPNVFLQAWAAGIPVVSTSTDPDQLLTSGGLGLRAGTIDAAAAALRRLAAAPDVRHAMGRRAWQHVWRAHRPEVVLPRLAEMLRALSDERISAPRPIENHRESRNETKRA